MMRLLPTLGDRVRSLLGAIEPDPEPPDLDALARKHARQILDMGHVDLTHPSAEDMLTWRIKAAIREDRQTRGRA